MLEIKNIKKYYINKKGVETKALDDVSLRFPETGMIFLLGKSGSGKSTLLNILGGLDIPTSGELIVKGRSSFDFIQSDFDSYRNTFIGFIFQEYNILNEFSVEDNIALALELQGKPKEKQSIDNLLAQVDLDGYGNRKPNTLSGGQKQRIAIARALIKDPQIIMADEPTGALDSKTGTQVLDTLKKLSHDRLVIIVSHDKEFAEMYADRIIEFKDGKVLSDISKTNKKQTMISDNINILDNVLTVKNGSNLSDNDFEKIKDFIKNSNKDILIASEEKDINNFKKVNNINEVGEKEFFAPTDCASYGLREYNKDEAKFVKSRLPYKHAIKLGLSGLKTKPIRLFFTVLLCTIAFVLFGLLSTLTFYNSEATFKKSLKDSNREIISVNKSYTTNVIWYYEGAEGFHHTSSNKAKFNQNDIEEIKKTFGNDVFGTIVNPSGKINTNKTDNPYFVNEIQQIGYLPENNKIRKSIIGNYPENNNEILISSYTASVLLHSGLYDSNGQLLNIRNVSELIGKEIALNNNTYRITGYFDSGAINTKYDLLNSSQVEKDNKLYTEFIADLEDGLYLIAFVSYDDIIKLSDNSYIYVDDGSDYKTISVNIKNDMSENPVATYPNSVFVNYNNLDSKNIFTFKDGNLESGQIIMPSKLFCERLLEYITDHLTNDNTQMYELSILTDMIYQGGYYNTNEDNETIFVQLSDIEIIAKINQLIRQLDEMKINKTVVLRLFNRDENTLFGSLKEYEIAGIYYNGQSPRQDIYFCENDYNVLWNEMRSTLSECYEVFTQYKETKEDIYDYLICPYDKSSEKTQIVWNIYKNTLENEDTSFISLAGNFSYNFNNVDETIKEMRKIFTYIGIIIALFAALLFSNFISVSISNKKHEIGILRAVGARSSDVFKIFFSESFFICLICIVISLVGCLILSGIINNVLSIGIGASVVVFGPVSLIVLVTIALLTSILATFIPVHNAARKKPVESIKGI